MDTRRMRFTEPNPGIVTLRLVSRPVVTGRYPRPWGFHRPQRMCGFCKPQTQCLLYIVCTLNSLGGRRGNPLSLICIHAEVMFVFKKKLRSGVFFLAYVATDGRTVSSLIFVTWDVKAQCDHTSGIYISLTVQPMKPAYLVEVSPTGHVFAPVLPTLSHPTD